MDNEIAEKGNCGPCHVPLKADCDALSPEPCHSFLREEVSQDYGHVKGILLPEML